MLAAFRTNKNITAKTVRMSQSHHVLLKKKMLYLTGERTSHVYGSIIGGRFAGTINTPEEVYHVEKAEFYFSKDHPRDFHSVIYKESDLQLSPTR